MTRSLPRSRGAARATLAAVCLAATVAGLVVPASSSAARVSRGHYECVTLGTGGQLQFLGHVWLERKSRYRFAAHTRNGRPPSDASRGKYRVRGSRITFSSGALRKAKWYGRHHVEGRRRYFELRKTRDDQRIASCYLKR